MLLKHCLNYLVVEFKKGSRMKKYKVFVDSNGKDSLWFHQGEKVENPLSPLDTEKSEVPAHQPSVEELNGAVLMKMFNLTGLLEHISFEAQHGWDTQVVTIF